MTKDLSEKRETLWMLAASPLIWVAHLLLCYLTAAIACAKHVGPGDSLAGVQLAIGLYTVLGLGGIALIGWRGARRHRYADSTLPHDFDSPADRHRFLGFSTLLLSGLSGLAVLYQALPALFIGSCR
jgi:hypothetical protein